MSAGALALWWAAFAAANALLLIGWALMIAMLALCLSTLAGDIRRGRRTPAPRWLIEITAGGFVLSQLGPHAGLILLDLKGL